MKTKSTLFSLLACWALALTTAAQTYILASPSATLNSDSWALESANMAGFRAAITDPAYFGANGTVTTSISVVDLATINAGSLANVSGLMVPWWTDAQSANYETAIQNAFLGGMDLWILQDDSAHDGVGVKLGIESGVAAGTPSNGSGPFFNGPFGAAANTGTYGNFAKFDDATVAALGGTVVARNTSGEATVVAWGKGAYAPGAGALLIFSDVDMISNWSVNHYTPSLDANGVLALNSMAWLAQGAVAVPEPSTYALLACGLAVVWFAARRKRG